MARCQCGILLALLCPEGDLFRWLSAILSTISVIGLPDGDALIGLHDDDDVCPVHGKHPNVLPGKHPNGPFTLE